MQISPVLRIKHLLLTFLTNCNIRRDKDLTLCLFTFDNVKLCITLRIFYVFHIYLQDCRPFWWSILDIWNKSADSFLWSLCIDFYIRTFVADISANLPLCCMAADCRPESYPLHDSIDTDLSGNLFTHKFLQSTVSLHKYSRIFIFQSTFQTPQNAVCLQIFP